MNKDMEKNKNLINECKASVPKTTIEDELRFAKIRIEELLDELKQTHNKVEEAQKKIQVLVGVVADEHLQRKNAFNEIEYAYKRVDKYRSAINDIMEMCHKVIKSDDTNTKPAVEQLAKEIFDIAYRF